MLDLIETEIQVVVVEVGQVPEIKIIKNDLDSLQKIVGGYIEVVTIGEDSAGNKLAIICNEEGKLQGLPPNRLIRGFDMMVGNFLIVSYDRAGNEVSLPDHDCKVLKELFTPLVVDTNSAM